MFCRNVLIYFDQVTKIEVLERIAGVTDATAFWLWERPRPWSG